MRMDKITINGVDVSVSPKTLKRIETIARRMEITFSEAVSFCLERSIDLDKKNARR